MIGDGVTGAAGTRAGAVAEPSRRYNGGEWPVAEEGLGADSAGAARRRTR
jgi:hypothetical protein